ncbi:4278_t:CDS:2 [Ambispora leptoticha]|uniref:4278_t:CDS:1 n=1 Tax=Ambispora leptoticha TaxID=144679 RepID=A0A9N9EWV0_9GLOM|nr:4278_t:CDS:2 [Ambispora leptoticha]
MDNQHAENLENTKKNTLVLPTKIKHNREKIIVNTKKNVVPLQKTDARLDDVKQSVAQDTTDWKKVAKNLKARLAFASFKVRHNWQYYNMSTCEKITQGKPHSPSQLGESFTPILLNDSSLEQIIDLTNDPNDKDSKKPKKRRHSDDFTSNIKKAKHQYILPTMKSLEKSICEDSLAPELVNDQSNTTTTTNTRTNSTTAAELNQFPILVPTEEQTFSNGWDPMLSDNFSQLQDLTGIDEHGAASSFPSTPPQQPPKTPTDEHAAELLYYFASSPVTTSPGRTPASRFPLPETHMGFTTPPPRTNIDTSTPDSRFSLSEFAAHPPLSDPHNNTSNTHSLNTPPAISLSFDDYVSETPRKSNNNTTPSGHLNLFTELLQMNSAATKPIATNSAFAQGAK